MIKSELISTLQKDGVLKTPSIIKAFQVIDRSKFIRPQHMVSAYEDEALHIGYDQTISQPRTVAFMLEKLQPRKGDRILDIGSGSGWTTALLAYVAGDEGSCIGTEIIEELVKFGQMNLSKYNLSNAKIIQSLPNILGYPQQGPYDKILVSASSVGIPRELLDQLVIGGILVMPVRNSMFKITKLGSDKYQKEEIYGFVFVPLIRPKH